MKIDKKLEGTALTLSLTGRLDTTSSPELEILLNQSLDGVTELFFDFANLDYLSSAGLRVLLSAQKKVNQQKGTMKLRNVNSTVKEVFDITGFTDFLTIE